MRFSKRVRLLDSESFRKVFREGIRVRSPLCELIWRACSPVMEDHKTEPTRLGIVVGKNVGDAVVRNRLKRVTREWFRASYEDFGSGDLLIRFFSGAAKKQNEEIRDGLTSLMLSVTRRACKS